MTKVMTAHQPNFLPYCGFFDKMMAVDEMGTEPGVFVLREDCQFVRHEFHYRNKIRTYENWLWLYVPVKKVWKSINEIPPISEISIRDGEKIHQVPWNGYHLRLIAQLYKNTPYFGNFFPGLEKIFFEPGSNLAKFNTRIINYLMESFDVKTKIISICDLPSSLRTDNPSKTLAEIARFLYADIYLSGDGGKNYLEQTYFGNDVKVAFQNYEHPVYPQRFPGFQPNMSAIDALFCIGRLPRSGEKVSSSVSPYNIAEVT
jgi:hypothetical protein